MTLLRMSLAVYIVVGGAMPALGQEYRAALIETFHSEIQALNTGDLDTAVASTHEKIVLYGLYSPFPIEGKSAFRQVVQEYFDEHESAELEIVYPRYQITDSTGVAWGNYRLTTKLKEGPVSTIPGQYMLTYARQAEEWLIISMHFAPLP